MEQPKQRDADRSRGAILDAAETLFAEHGFEAVTMAQVGAAAGVSRGTPGYFFGTKEALYRIVVERAAATLRMLAETLRVRDAAGNRQPDELLKETVTAFLSLLTTRASLVKLIDRENGIVAGEPHAEALRDALSGLGNERDRVALIALAMCWFPVSHPGAARLLGVDPGAPEFAEVWRDEVVTALGGTARITEAAQTIAAPVPIDPFLGGAERPPMAPEYGDDSADGPKKKKKKKKKKG